MTSVNKVRAYIDDLNGCNNRRPVDRINRSSVSYMAYEKHFSYDSIKFKNHSISLFDEENTSNSKYFLSEDSLRQKNDLVFGTQETAVFMTLFDDLSYNRTLRTQSTAGTQATASINKCFQVQHNKTVTDAPSTVNSKSYNYSSYTMTTLPYYDRQRIDGMRYSDVYFFGRKRDPPKPDKMEMGKKGKLYKSGHTNSMPVQTSRVTGASTGTSTKTVSIKDDKSCNEITCPAIAQSIKGEMVATVSHIRLGPREPCPVHGNEPCQGPKCIVASSGEEKAPVKVTTMSNPRRGVFELVIRRITGAPLAKNELMLEWTPPPYQSPCGPPCMLPCSPVGPPCYPSKCKMIVCRPTSCKPKCRKPCGPPCRSMPCSSCCNKPCRPSKSRRPCPPPRCRPCPPCKPCNSCRPCPPPRKIFKRPCPSPCCKPCGRCSACSPCGPPPPCKPAPPCRPCRRCRRRPPPRCRPCKPCPPSPPCRPFPPPPCPPCPPICSPSPCCSSPCRPSCTSTPCLPPCSRCCKKTRKCKSHPRIRAHRKRISPCFNRSKCCPVVRCRSLPSTCVGCCGILPCPPRKCCQTPPCKPPRCCKSSCSTCCA